MRRNHGRARFSIILSAFLSLATGLLITSNIAFSATMPVVHLNWIDERGNTAAFVGKVTKLEWRSNHLNQDGLKFDAPGLRATIETAFPKDWEAKQIIAEGVAVVDKPARPFSEIKVDLLAMQGTVNVHFQDGRGRFHDLSLVMVVSVPQTTVFISPRCIEHGVKIDGKPVTTKQLFISIDCFDEGDRIKIVFVRSNDSMWRKDLSPKGLKEDQTYFVHIEPKTAASTSATPPKSKRLFSIGTLDTEEKPSEFFVIYTPSAALPPKRTSWSVGLGTSLYSYGESVLKETLSETAISGKANFSYTLVPGKYDLGLGVFATLVPITHSPATIAPARFFGLNARFGYQLPVYWKGLTYMIMPGVYFWGMNASGAGNSEYGVSAASGPQLYFFVSDRRQGNRTWWGYFKFALISDSPLKYSIGSSNEIAVGGGYQLNAISAKPWSVTIDFAMTKYALLTHWMELKSITAGIQKAL